MPPNGDAAQAISELERTPGKRPGDAPRRVLAKDGLHVSVGRAEGTRENPSEELALHALVSSARHELRAPLQSIQGFAELLATESYGTLGTDQRVFVEHIIHGSVDLSRALDACFDLLQAEVLHVPAEPLRTPLRHLMDEAVMTARGHVPCPLETSFALLDDSVLVEVDLHDFSKAINAIITALAPIARGPLVINASPREGQIEVMFTAVPGETRPLRGLSELPRRGLSARAMLWLRLAGALLGRASAQLETSEGYDRVRVLFPLGRPEA